MLSFLISLILLLLAVSQYARMQQKKWLFIVFFSLALALLSYVSIGVMIVHISGHGRFYSLPFGGLKLKDSSVLQSLLCWGVAWAFVAWRMTRKRKF